MRQIDLSHLPTTIGVGGGGEAFQGHENITAWVELVDLNSCHDCSAYATGLLLTGTAKEPHIPWTADVGEDVVRTGLRT